MRNDSDNLIVRLTFELALYVVSFSEKIRANNRFEMASQIFRSGTSIGANIRELKMPKAKETLVISLKFQQKKLMN